MSFRLFNWVVIPIAEIKRESPEGLAMMLHHEYKHYLDGGSFDKGKFERSALLFSFFRMQDQGYDFDYLWELEADGLMGHKYKMPSGKLKQWLKEKLNKDE